MSRLRLGVALMLPEPLTTEVQGLRRACGDHGRMDPHLTLVPPVNVRETDIPEALHVLQAAASVTRPFTLTLGPPNTFMPDNPVLYLEVGGNLDALLAFRERVFVGPLSRELSWPFTPHVTICDSGEPARLDAAVLALSDYQVEVRFERVHLLHEQPHDGTHHHKWVPFIDIAFAEPAVVGRGGFELELITSECLDPWSKTIVDSWELGELDAEHSDIEPSDLEPSDLEPGDTEFIGVSLVIRALHMGVFVGVLKGHYSGNGAVIDSCIVSPDERRQGIGRHLIASFLASLAARGVTQVSAWIPSRSSGEQWLRSAGFEPARSAKDHLHLVRWI